MKYRPWKWAVSILAVFGLFIYLNIAIAQEFPGVNPGEELTTNPKDRDISVTASVPEPTPTPVPTSAPTVAPEPPILISPGNGSYSNQPEQVFKWKLQEHQISYAYLDLSVDGSVLISHLPAHSYETSQYLLIVSGYEYYLKLKAPLALTEGQHTWKVRAIDTGDNGRDSTTWTFTIDSQDPQIVIVQIDSQVVTISSNDSSTWTVEPYLVEQRKPKVFGLTEADSDVQLDVVFSDHEKLTLTTASSDTKGEFSFTLPYLPNDQVVELRFTVLDHGGNTVALDQIFVKFIVQPVVVIPAIPGLFADPIPLRLPGFPSFIAWLPIIIPQFIDEITVEVVKPAAQQAAAPVLPLYTVWQNWLATYQNLLTAAVIWLWLSYTLALYAGTGGKWRYYPNFLLTIVGAWLGKQGLFPNRWISERSKQPLPWLVFELEEFDTSNSKLRRYLLFTNLEGQWLFPWQTNLVYGVNLPNRVWQKVIDPSVLQTNWTFKEQFLATQVENTQSGISILPLSAPQLTTKSVTSSSGVSDPSLPDATLPDVKLTLLASHSARPGWLLWLPRLILVWLFVVCVLLSLASFSWQTVAFFVITIFIAWRDWQWQLPRRFGVHFE